MIKEYKRDSKGRTSAITPKDPRINYIRGSLESFCRNGSLTLSNLAARFRTVRSSGQQHMVTYGIPSNQPTSSGSWADLLNQQHCDDSNRRARQIVRSHLRPLFSSRISSRMMVQFPISPSTTHGGILWFDTQAFIRHTNGNLSRSSADILYKRSYLSKQQIALSSGIRKSKNGR